MSEKLLILLKQYKNAAKPWYINILAK